MATDKSLFFITVGLIFIGIVFSLSLSVFATLLYDVNEFYFFIRQLIVGLFSIWLIWYISQLDPDKHLKIIGFSLFFICLILMTTMHFLPENLVKEIGGAKRWIKFPGFSFAPVEFFKIGFIYFLAWSFSRKIDHSEKTLLEELKIFLPYVGAFGLVIYLIAIMQNDLGQVIVIGFTLAFMAFFAGTSARFFVLAVFMSILVFIFAIVNSAHRISRIKVWWSTIQDMVLSMLPESLEKALRVKDAMEPYQISHSLNAINNGGVFGEGLGNGILKLGFLSEVHTDFVLAGISEEIGAFGLTFVLILFFLLVFRILKIANRSEDKTNFLFALGIGLIIVFSFFINAFGVTGIIPIKGIAVPFLSYGGSSLLAHSIAIGMVLMISKRVKNL